MSWGWMPALTGHKVSATRAHQGFGTGSGQAFIEVGCGNGPTAGSGWVGNAKPNASYPLGWEPNYDPTTDSRYDLPQVCFWLGQVV